MCHTIISTQRFASLFFLFTAFVVATLNAALQAQAPTPESAGIPIQHHYVPVSELHQLLTPDQKGVLLPRKDFEELYEKASEAKRTQPQLPQQPLVTGARYSGEIKDDQLQITAEIDLTQFADHWQKIPLLFSRLSVESATVNGEPARLGRTAGHHGGGAQSLYLLHDQVGQHRLNMQLTTQLVSVGSDQVASFRLLQNVPGKLTLTLPVGKNVIVNGLEIQPVENSDAVDNDAQRFEVACGGLRELTLQFTDHKSQATTDALILATTASGAYVVPGEVSWQAVTALQVHGRQLDRLTMDVPKLLEIADVHSSGLEDWQLADSNENPQRTELTLNYRQPFDGQRKVVLKGMMSVPVGESWRFPTLSIKNVSSHISRIVVRHPHRVRVTQLKSDGIQRMGQEEEIALFKDLVLAEDNAHSELRFNAWREDFDASFITQMKQREIQAALTTGIDINQQGLDLLVTATVQTEFAPLFDLNLTIPAEWSVTGVSLQSIGAKGEGSEESVDDWQMLSEEAGVNQIRVPLAPPLQPGESMKFLLVARREMEDWPPLNESVDFALPEVRLLGSSVTEGYFLIKAEESFLVKPDNITGLDPAFLGKHDERFGYEYQDTRFSGNLHVSTRPAQIAAHTLAISRLDPDTLRTRLEVLLDVSGSGVRDLEIALPDHTNDDLQFQALLPVQMPSDGGTKYVRQSNTLIVEQQLDRKEGGEKFWNIRFDRLLTGKVLLTTNVETPRPNDTQVFSPHTLRVPAAERVDGHLAIEAAPDQRLSITAVDANELPLSDVDPVDLLDFFDRIPMSTEAYVPRERIVAAYHHSQPQFRVTFTEQRFKRVAVPRAVCSQLSMTSIPGRGMEGDRCPVQNRLEMQFRAVGVQAIHITPEESADLWSATLDEKPIEVRQRDGRWFIPLPAPESVEAPRQLKISYRTQMPELDLFGRLEAVAPELQVAGGNGKLHPLVILEREWEVAHPPEMALLDHSGRFHAQQPLERISVLGWLEQEFGLPPLDQLWQQCLVVAILAAILLLLTLSYRRWGLWGCGGLLLLAGGLGVVVIAGLTLQTGLYEAAPGQMTDSIAKQKSAPMSGADHLWQEEMTEDNAGFEENFDGESGESQGEATDSDKPPEQPGEDKAEEHVANPSEPMSQPVPETPPVQQPAGPTANQPATDPFGDGNADNTIDESAPQTGKSSTPIANKPRPTKPAPARMTTENQARLSLAMNLDAPADYSLYTFRYVGSEMDTSVIRLAVTYAHRDLSRVFQLFILIATLCLFWWIRKSSLRVCVIAAVSGLFVPLALVAVAPISWQVVLDGLFFGSLGGIALWVIQSCAICCQKFGLCALNFCRRKTSWMKRRTTTSAALLAALTLWQFHSGCLLLAQSPLSPRNSFQPNAVPPQANLPLANQQSGTQPLANQSDERLRVSLSRVPSPATVPPNSRDQVIIPFEPGSDPLQAGHVFVPQPLFLKMWNHAYPERSVKPAAPVDGFVSGATYSAEVVSANTGEDQLDARRVSVSARYVVHSFRDSQIRIPLPIAPVALSSATLNGQPAPLVTILHAAAPQGVEQHDPNAPNPGLQQEARQPVPQDPFSQQRRGFQQFEQQGAQHANAPAGIPLPRSRTLAVLIDKPGQHVVDLKFEANAEFTGPAGSMMLHLYPVAAGRLTLQMPENDLQIRVNGSSGNYRRESVSERERVTFPIDDGGRISVSWQPKTDAQKAGTFLQAESSTNLAITDAGLDVTAEYRYRVRQGAITELTFSLPMDFQVRRLSGEDVGGWRVEAGDQPNRRKVQVFLRRNVVDSTRITFRLFRQFIVSGEASTVQFPQINPLDVTREAGQIGLLASDSFAILSHSGNELSQINREQYRGPSLQKTSAGELQSAYRFNQRPFALALDVSRRKPEAHVSAQHAAHVQQRKTIIESRFAFHLESAPRSHVSVRLPEEFLPLKIDATAIQDWHVVINRRTGARDLIVEMPQPRTGLFEVILRGSTPRDPGFDFADVNVPYATDVDKATTTLGIQIDESYSAVEFDVQGWEDADVRNMSQQLRSLVGDDVPFAYQSGDLEPSPVLLTLMRQRPQFRAEVINLVTVADSFVDMTFVLQWTIQQAPADSFAFSLPKDIARRIRFLTPGIRQVKRTSLPDGRTRVNILLQRPQSERFNLHGTATLPVPISEELTAPVPVIEVATVNTDGEFQTLDAQRRIVILVDQSTSHFVTVPDVNLQPVQADSLKIRLRESRLVQATDILQLRSESVIPRWRITRPKRQSGAAAVVNMVDLLTIFERDGTWRTQATYRVRNRTRQFLAVDLPENARLLSLFVQGQPSRPVKSNAGESGRLFVPLPKTSRAEPSFEIRLIIAGRLLSSLDSPEWKPLGRDVDLPAPHVVTDGEHGVPVAQTRWRLYLPEDLEIDPMSDLNRNNMSIATSEESELVQRVSLLKELHELSSELETGKLTHRQNYFANENLQKKESQLRNWDRSAQQFSGKEGERYQELLDEVLGKIEINKKNIVTDSQQQKAIITRPGGFSNLQLEIDGLKQDLEQQQQELLRDNFNDLGLNPGDESDRRGFRIEHASPQSKPASGSQSGEKSSSRPSSRTKVRAQSKQQLGELSRRLEQNRVKGKSSVQIPQGLLPVTDTPDTPDTNAGNGRNNVRPFRENGEQSDLWSQIDQAGSPVNEGWGFVQTDFASVGGLSLDMEIPTTGKEYSFTKAGGAPKLALNLRSRESLDSGLGFLWSAIWIVIVIVVISAAAKGAGTQGPPRMVPFALLVVGLLIYFLLPMPVSPIGLFLMLLGGVFLAIRHRRPSSSAGTAQ